MKKLIVLFCVLYSLPLYAQHGLYIALHAGIGRTDVVYRATGFLGSFEFPHDRDLGFAAGIDAGYRLRSWNLQTGIGLIRTGYMHGSEIFDINTMTVIGSASLHYRYMHLIVPLAAGYNIPLLKRLSVEPLIGVDLSYNLNEQRKSVYLGRSNFSNTPAETFDSYFSRTAVFGRGSAALRYSLGSRIGIQAGATGRYMLTNFIKKGAIATGSAKYQHPWIITFDASVSYVLQQKKLRQRKQ